MSENVAGLRDREAAWGTATPELLEAERSRIGKELSPGQPFVEVATRDAIRHWAEGIGDRNPLWLDREYASQTRWGGLIAPPTIVMAMNPNIISTAARGFGGLHSWHLGNAFEWYSPIREGMEFTGRSTLEGIKEVESSYAGGTAYDQTVLTELSDAASGELVCQAWTYLRRFERTAGQSSTKYARRERHVYSDDEVEDIAAAYAREVAELRLGDPRYVEDVSVGDELPSIIRGPLTTADCVTFAMGWGGSFMKAHGFAWDFMMQKPSAFPRNESNIPDSPERTHYVDEFAQAIGAPAAFDYGPQRIAWCQTLVTNWLGDDGRLVRLGVRITRPNYHGDLVTLSGVVREITDDRQVVIGISGTNQVDEVVVEAEARVELPRRD